MRTRAIVAVLALFLFAGLAKAEIGFGEAIEWTIADSDRVIIGKIAKVEKAGQNEIVTVEVSKTLRGEHKESIQFTVTGQNVADTWQKAGIPMLFGLVKRDRVKDGGANTDLVLRLGSNQHSVVFLGKTDQRGADVFTRHFGELTDAAAIQKHVEAYAKTISADWKRKSVNVDLPFDAPAHKKLYGGSAVYFTLPVDPTLESDARKWCKSKREDDRSRAIRCLKEFPNEENIKLIKGLLADDSYSSDSGKKYYYIRRGAYEALREMGVKVTQPVLEEPAN